jgi:chromosomal replication initiator protein
VRFIERRSIRTRRWARKLGRENHFCGICGGSRLGRFGQRYGRPPVRDDAAKPDLDSIWREAQDRLRASVPESTFQLWLEPLKVVGSRAETLLLTGPENIRAWTERRYSGLLREALSSASSSLSDVSLVPEGQSASSGPEYDAGLDLNVNYTFDRFVIGAGNRIAHAAALAVAEAPSEAYNPLFLHGPPGLGKTHLLVAIANYLASSAPELNVRYTTAERFTNEFVAALRTAGAEGFKRRYRDLDVLLVDDVQFLEGKRHTEDEFFHTFNALYEGGSQLVLSADRIPSELSSLESRLRDRFEWGLTVAVEPPNLATRLAVLRRLVREAGIDTEGDVLGELARRIDINVRQLHGALTRVIAHASLTARPLSPELIDAVIPKTARAPQSTPVEEIQDRVSAAFGISRAELVGSTRAARPVSARQVAIYLTRELTELSLPQIGRLYGGRDHSTVHNAIRRAEARCSEDSVLAAQVQELRAAIHNESTGRR